jgi:hypothetical protein
MTPDLPGGTRHFDIASELVRRGHRVVLFASSFHHGRFREMKLVPGEKARIEDCGGVQVVWVKTFPYRRNDWRRYLNMLSFGRAAKLSRRWPGEVIPSEIVIVFGHLLAVWAASGWPDHTGRVSSGAAGPCPDAGRGGKMALNPVVRFLYALKDTFTAGGQNHLVPGRRI